jgi:hypothetical protein
MAVFGYGIWKWGRVLRSLGRPGVGIGVDFMMMCAKRERERMHGLGMGMRRGRLYLMRGGLSVLELGVCRFGDSMFKFIIKDRIQMYIFAVVTTEFTV